MSKPPRPTADALTEAQGRGFSIALAYTAGFADAFGYLTLHGLLVAHVTGNLAFMAVGIARGNPHILLKFFAVPIFVAGIMLATFILTRAARRPAAMLAWALGLEAAFFAASGVALHVLPPIHGPDDGSAFCVAILLLMAMATQNAMMRLFLSKLRSTTAMTINIAEGTVRYTEWLAGPRDALSAEGRRALITGSKTIAVTVGSFAVGAICGGVGALRLGSVALAIPVLVLLFLAWRAASFRATASDDSRASPEP